MADTTRIVTFDRDNNPVVEFDLTDSTYSPVRDTLKVANGASQLVMADTGRRWGGSRAAGESHTNGQLECEWYVRAADDDATVAATEALFAALTDDSEGRYLEWCPDGASRSVFWELRGPGAGESMYRWIEFESAGTIHAKGVAAVAPVAIGLPMDWTWRAGTDAFTATGWSQPQGGWGADALGLYPSVADTDVIAVIERDEYDDVEVTMELTYAGATNDKRGVLLGYIDELNYIKAQYQADDTLVITAIVAGVAYSTSAAVATTGHNTAGVPVYLTVRLEGGKVIAYSFTSQPWLGRTTAETTDLYLGGTALELFGPGRKGKAGLLVDRAGAREWSISRYDVRPYTYTSTSAPREHELRGIPGTLPAQAEVQFARDGTVAQKFGLVGWAPVRERPNLVWNGHLEDAEDLISGWTTNVGGWTTATLAHDATQAKYGTKSLKLTSGAGLEPGAAFFTGDEMVAGRPIFTEAWFRPATVDQRVMLTLWTPSIEVQLASPTLPHSTWTRVSAQYGGAYGVAPSVPMAVGVGWFGTPGAGLVMYVDGVRSWWGYEADAPAGYPSREGRGARPPYGVCDSSSAKVSTWTLNAAYAGARGSRALTWSPTVAGTAHALWYLDPGALEGDTFSGGDLSVEVWARVRMAATLVGPRMALSAGPDLAVPNAVVRYTTEYGSAGKPLSVPAAQSWRWVRLGTLTLPAEAATERQRWFMNLATSVGAATTGEIALDHLMLVPARARAASPTAKYDDAAYPAFIPGTTANTIKSVGADLRGRLGVAADPMAAAPGLGGSPIELPSGDVVVVTHHTDGVPDDPNTGATSDTWGRNSAMHYAITPRYYFGAT